VAGCCAPAPKSLVIETTVLRVDGETCERCGGTVEAVRSTVAQLDTVLTPLGERVTLIEHAASADNLEDSNSVMISGRWLEEWIGAERVSTDCPSCGDLVEEAACCGAVSVDGAIQESFSVQQVRDAAFAALGLGGSGGCC
jgi:hypothetical protein